MLKKGDIEKLAALSRIAVEEGELPDLLHDLEKIVSYVSLLDTVEVSAVPETIDTTPMRNVLRKDEMPHEPGVYTAELLDEAPSKKNSFVSVKAILHNE
ncbi:MAG: Asp-tRNA(Asn)/Glu-tRNA(Gln) amidotransferase subunit GatC [bacterium]|nr:Asp-tRNA(Asn)/Glu-tRNA(Gln) amidotransferase subunit GatC [bacterium]